jgi:predicted pyridoxine 5'-phosphate oxidase superfamily flavin-nucleotide-binding protein
VRLSPEMQQLVLEQRLGFVATVTSDGRPNLSPKGTTTLWDQERLMFADLASPRTVENLATNSHIEVNVIDPIARKGFRFKGTGKVYRCGEVFERGLTILQERGLTAARDRVRSIVVIDVAAAAAVISPAYDDGTSENVIVQRWLQHHNDLHRQRLPEPRGYT